MHGDQTGEELLLQALRLTENNLLGLPFDLQHFDLSLKNRRATKNGVVGEAGKAMLTSRLGLKAATITPEQAGDVGSPNAIIRNDIHAQVILRTSLGTPVFTDEGMRRI
jgi:isocitrate dehydrogenase